MKLGALIHVEPHVRPACNSGRFVQFQGVAKRPEHANRLIVALAVLAVLHATNVHGQKDAPFGVGEIIEQNPSPI